MKPATCGHPVGWHQCYAGGHDLWVSEAYSHPAKMGPALCFRILDHLKELGLLTGDDTVLDFMAGIGTTLLVAGVRGYKAVGVELEPKFVDLCVSYWCLGIPKITLREITLPADEGGWRTEEVKGEKYSRLYCVKPVPERKRWQVVSQCRCGKPDWHPVHWVMGNIEYVSKKVGRELPITVIQGDARHLSELLGERGCIGVTSPPYSDTARKVTGESPQGKIARLEAEGKHREAEIVRVHGQGQAGDLSSRGYGNTKGQIADLPDRVIAVTSPPYEDSNIHRDDTWENGQGFGGPHSQVRAQSYGRSEGQIGQERAESYLSAMRLVYQEAYKVCDVLAVVTKNPTRDGQLRRLDLDTISLLEEVGFTIRCVHKAILFEELEGGHMFEGSKKRVKGRLSFFKRLSYQKGSPVADHEDIIIAVRDGGGLKGITSPPYISGGHHDGIFNTWGGQLKGDKGNARDATKEGGYPQTPGQIGNLKGD